MSFIFASYVSVSVENVSTWQENVLGWDPPCRQVCVEPAALVCVCAWYQKEEECVSGLHWHV